MFLKPDQLQDFYSLPAPLPPFGPLSCFCAEDGNLETSGALRTCTDLPCNSRTPVPTSVLPLSHNCTFANSQSHNRCLSPRLPLLGFGPPVLLLGRGELVQGVPLAFFCLFCNICLFAGFQPPSKLRPAHGKFPRANLRFTENFHVTVKTVDVRRH